MNKMEKVIVKIELDRDDVSAMIDVYKRQGYMYRRQISRLGTPVLTYWSYILLISATRFW